MLFNELVEKYCPLSLVPFAKDNMHLINGISNFLDAQEEEGKITPRIELILSAFHLVSMDPEGLFPNSLRVVFMFQDTYPTPGAACGVAITSLNDRVQPTLRNFYQRIVETYEMPAPVENNQSLYEPPIYNGTKANMPQRIPNGDVRGWAAQGILMLNAGLSTLEYKKEAHIDAWSLLMPRLIEWISTAFPFVVFVLFGKVAQSYKGQINASKHHILTTSHPGDNGYNRGFGTSDIFNEVNRALTANHRPSIQWEDFSYI